MRVFALLILLVIALVGDEWCVYYSTQSKIYDNEDTLFQKRFTNAYILFDGRYYRFLIGPYTNKQKAFPALKRARKFHRDAFVKRCPVKLKEEVKKPHVERHSSSVEISQVFKREALKRKEQQFHNSNIVKKDVKKSAVRREEKRDDEQGQKILDDLEKERFYRLSFYEFMNRFLYKSPYGEQESLNFRLKKLDALLEDVPYNWDLFLLGTARYSKFIDFNLAQNKELVLQGGVGFSKKLFDSGYIVKNNLKRLHRRLAKSNYFNAMDKLYLYGAQIYLNALTEQKIRELYEQNFFKQKAFKEIVHERFLSKVATRVDDIDAEDDLLNIKKRLLERMYAYLYSDYLLRNSAELVVKKPLKLSWFGVSLQKKPLQEYYKNALLHSSSIESQKLKEMIEKKKLIKSRYFFLPQLTFNSLVYDEYRKDLSVTPSQIATGLNYQIGLTLRMSLYNRTFLDELQRARIRTNLERERLKTKIKDVMRDIHKAYNEILKLKNKRSIVKQQLQLAKEKMEITKKRYMGGVGIYRDYSDAINEFLAYQEELYNLDAQLLMSRIYLNLLEGIQRPYEQN